MVHFNFYLREKLTNSGYGEVLKHDTENDLFLASPLNERIWVCYLDKAIDPEQIRRCFDFPGHVLFVVDEKLIPQEIESKQQTPEWLRVLHALYMGRIYTWDGRRLFGLHFDWDTGEVSESGIIQPDELLLGEIHTWKRGWTDAYRIARFYDKRWWGETTEEKVRQRQNASQQSTGDSGYAGGRDNYYAQSDHAKQSNARADYEQARDHYWQQQREREQKANSKYPWERDEWYVPPEVKPEPSKPDFMREFARAGSPSAVKALYRELAKKYHPDLNPGVDTTLEMQAVNAAYEVYK